MNDRLADLHNTSISQDFNETELVEVSVDGDYSEAPAGLQEFNDEVNRIRTSIAILKSNIETLSSGYRTVLVSTDSTTQEEENRKLEERIESSIKEIAASLKKMGTENAEASDHNRWRSNIHSHMTKTFMDLMVQYRGLQSDHREKIQERIRQRLRIVKPDATPEQVQHVVDGGKLNVFAEELYKENQQQARDALVYVEGRHRELVKIEESVNELHRLFCDMAVLVNAQGEYIDNIEANVSQSVAFVEQANKDLVQANKRASKRRWCKFWSAIICLILLVIAVIVVVVIGSSNHWFGLKN